MNAAYLLIGGNMGDREHYLEAAREEISRSCGLISRRSAVYQTEAWGLKEQAPFLNQALELQTELEALPLLRCLLQIEEALGRVREEKYGPRFIDLDIIFYNEAVLQQPGLTVPHPQMQYRRFVLQCLCDLIPSFVHPTLRLTVAELLQRCEDPSQVCKT